MVSFFKRSTLSSSHRSDPFPLDDLNSRSSMALNVRPYAGLEPSPRPPSVFYLASPGSPSSTIQLFRLHGVRIRRETANPFPLTEKSAISKPHYGDQIHIQTRPLRYVELPPRTRSCWIGRKARSQPEVTPILMSHRTPIYSARGQCSRSSPF